MKVCAITLIRDTPDLVDAMRSMIPDVRIIDNGSVVPVTDSWRRLPINRYFSGGFNAAMTDLYAEQVEWAWMLNSDVSGVSVGIMESLLKVAEQLGVPVVSPSVPSSVWLQMKAIHTTEAHFVDWVAPLVNVRWFVLNGGFDYNLPGWGSDIDLCYRTRHDMKIVAGRNVIQHPYGTTSKRCNDKAMYQLKQTQRYLIWKHGEEIKHFIPNYFRGMTP